MGYSNVICVFAECPRPGMVKNRLEQVLGGKQAAFLARAFLLDTISNSLRVKNTSIIIAHWPPESREDFEDIIHLFCREEKNRNIRKRSADIHLIPQQGADPGERMAGISENLFGMGAEKVLITGSDSPQLHPSIFRAALELLNKKQVVLGPTFDGGYYMIGLRNPCPGIFNGISWGSPAVYKETAKILIENKIDWEELELSYDIDSPENLEQLYMEIDTLRLTGENRICFHTERCLKNLTE
ncbi:MAG: TIGR04282 family arsenosugar biosynthesis glycosyltransferase [Candidatus Zixiibacteriota bacterium]|nr:MAG: TIGR04282 family arsenosugar biosynthesis glycosyltransferase [candidate division Zixibacteria bacterium]